MAKYQVKMSCGHTEIKELTGKNADREKKIRYYEEQGLCSECYKNMKQEEAKAEGLIFNAVVLPYVDETDGGILLQIYFSGDTMSHKDEIKSLDNDDNSEEQKPANGYKWSERLSGGDYFSYRPQLCWNKIIKIENLQEEIAKAISIGAKSLVTEHDLFTMVNYKMALEKQTEWKITQAKKKEIQDKIAAIEKPAVPDLLIDCKWNKKIYGKPESYSVYLDGEKTEITDEQAEEIRVYLAAEEAYRNKVKEITK